MMTGCFVQGLYDCDFLVASVPKSTESGMESRLKALLDHHADVNISDRTVIMCISHFPLDKITQQVIWPFALLWRCIQVAWRQTKCGQTACSSELLSCIQLVL